MTHKNAKHYAAKHPSETKLNQKVTDLIKEKSIDRQISCASLHQIASQLTLIPYETGVATDLIEYKINQCQLGLFGCSSKKIKNIPITDIPPTLKTNIKKLINTIATDNHLSCFACWKIAETVKLPKITILTLCETLKIKICNCQLGAF